MVKQKQTLSTMVKQKQRTGNVHELLWDSGLTTWDNGLTIWDKDLIIGLIKQKQSSSIMVKQGQAS